MISDPVRSKILVVDDDVELLESVCDALGDVGYEAVGYLSSNEALEALRDSDFDVVLTDIRMPAVDGTQLCERIAGNHPTVPVVLMTAYGDVDAAARATRAGAFDFVTKPVSTSQLQDVLQRALRARGSYPSTRRLAESTPPVEYTSREIVGSSPAMRSLMQRIRRVARSGSTVLVRGESGTGKELVARTLHDLGSRAEGPFVALNCAAIPEELLESELFGHAKGAFTGATAARSGLFRSAHGGTLFLDEIGAISLKLQPKLLRALQERKARPVGEADEIPFDCRVVAATNLDLKRLVTEGKFREDLLFRLDVVSLEIPPLRDRGDDVRLLARHLLRKHAKSEETTFTPEAEELFLSYSWPGNVRELENCVQAALAYSGEGTIDVSQLPAKLKGPGERRQRTPKVGSLSLDEIERQHIESVLASTGGNKAKAAELLGIDRTTLYRKIKRYGLDV